MHSLNPSLSVNTQIDGLVQDCSISIVNALKIIQYCSKPSKSIEKMTKRTKEILSAIISDDVSLQNIRNHRLINCWSLGTFNSLKPSDR